MKRLILVVVFSMFLMHINAQKSVSLYWDASYSMLDRNLEKELQFLDNYFKAKPNIDVKLTMFSNDIILKETFRVNEGSWESLKEELTNTIYDGATVYDNLFNDETDEYLIFTDGIENMNKFQLKTPKPFRIISSSPNTHVIELKLQADLLGGTFIYLTDEVYRPKLTVNKTTEQMVEPVDQGIVNTNTQQKVEKLPENLPAIEFVASVAVNGISSPPIV